MSIRPCRRAPWLVVPLFCLCFAGTAPSPSFSLTTTTSFKVAGWLGKVLSKVGPNEITKRISVSGDYLLESGDDIDRIVSLPDSQFVTINHARKTYQVMPFSMYRAALQSGASAENGDDGTEEKPTHKVRLDFSLDRPGDFETIDDRRTERFILTIIAEALPIDADGNVAEAGEKLVLAIEQFRTEQPIDGYEVLRDFQLRYAQALGAAIVGEGMLARIKQALGDDPSFQEAMQRAQEAESEMTGTIVKSTTHIVKVPVHLDYDGDLVFGEKKQEKKKGGLGRFAKKLAQQAAGVDIGAEKEEKTQAQRTLLTTTEQHGDFSTADVNIMAKMPPPEYTEVSYGSSN